MTVHIWMVSWCIACCFNSAYSLSTYYCIDGQTQSIMSNGTKIYIKTRKSGSQFHDNNLKCSWMLDAGRRNGRIQVTVESADFQWSPLYTTCSGYDNLQFVEGTSNRGVTITSLCGSRNPYTVVSRGRHMFLQFSSTHQNFKNHGGAELLVEVFDTGSCPPGWFQSSDSSPYCFMIGSRGKAKWARSQEICTFSQANLAFINDETEFNTILAAGRNVSTQQAWIGLNDIATEGQLQWLDSTAPSFQRSIIGQKYNYDCVAQDFDTGSWVMGDCKRIELNYVCKTRKDGTTKLYQAGIISKPPDEGSEGTNLFHIVIIVVAIIIVFGGAVFIYFCCYRKGRCCFKRSRHQLWEEELSQSVGFQPSHNDPAPPPAYHDVVKSS